MNIFVLIDKKTYSIVCNLSDTISNLKTKLNKKVALSNNYWLSYCGKILLDDYKVYDYLVNDCNIYLNYRPLDYVKIISGNKSFLAELSMLLESDILPFEFDKFNGDYNKLDKIIDNFDNIIYLIPEKYLDDNIFNIWYKLFKLTSNDDKKIYFYKPINKSSINFIPRKYTDILKSLKLLELVKLNNLMSYLNVNFLFELVSYYIGIIINNNINNLEKIYPLFKI